jgi:thiamine-phosphate diphosphorylase
VTDAVRAGVDWVQVRDRSLGGAALLAFAEAVGRAARAGAAASGRPVRLLVNRRTDVALAIAADGVHLGFDAVDPETARRILGDGALIGVSTHSAAEAAALRGASYVQLAPIFEPLSKATARPALGIDAVAAAARGPNPVIAQGGLTAQNAAAVVAAGAAGAAVTGAVLLARDPGAAAAALRRALDGVPC